MKLFRNTRGDTIVEVLISISVLSLILTASYALANRSSQGVRQAQERSEALKITEGLLEKLKSELSDGKTPDIASCFGSCSSGPDGRYTSVISKDASGATYTVYTSWDTLKGTKDSFSMVYRVYPANPGNVDLTAEAGPDPCAGAGYPREMVDNLCVPVPPMLSVNVRKVNPEPGLAMPTCSSSNTSSKPTQVLIDGSASGLSPIVNKRVGFGTSYNVSYTLPAGYTACPGGTSKSVTTGPSPTDAGKQYAVDFKILPNCRIEYINDPGGTVVYSSPLTPIGVVNVTEITYLFYPGKTNANGHYYFRSNDTSDYSTTWYTGGDGRATMLINRLDSYPPGNHNNQGWLRIFMAFKGDWVYKTEPLKVPSRVCTD